MKAYNRSILCVLTLLFFIGVMASSVAAQAYWVDNSNNLWTKTNITAGVNTTLYIQKTPGYSPNSDGVFEFYDGFDGSSLDTNKWTVGAGSATVSGSTITVSSIATIFTTPTFGVNYTAMWRGTISTGLATFVGWQKQTSPYERERFYGAPSFSSENCVNSVSQTAISGYSGGTSTFEIRRRGTTDAQYVIDGVVKVTNANQLYTSAQPFMFQQSGSGTITADWFAIRKYNATEPIVSTTTQTFNGIPYYVVNITSGTTLTGYQVNLSNPFGVSSSTDSVYISDTQPVSANFTANVTSGFASLPVLFTDSSTGSPTMWNYSYGDGTANGTTQNPTHIYTSGNHIYTVTLTAANPASSSVFTRTNYITVSDPVPTASFTKNVSSGNAPLSVAFTDTSTGLNITTWLWQYGDGTANGTTASPTHTYTNVGTYTVNLTVTNNGGSNKSTSQTITVYNATPSASFTKNKTEGNAPLSVSFTDTSTGSGITNWLWYFGDGTTSTQQSPSHVYNSAGIYNANLTVTNDGGSNTAAVQTITVHNATPSASGSANVTSGNAPLSILFSDTSTGSGITSWLWKFGNGDTSTSQNPVYTYNIAGTYNANVTATNDGGSSTSSNIVITVHNATPVVSFSANVTSAGYPHNILFTDASTGSGITAYNYSFGDGTYSNSQNPVHNYSAGTYTVIENVTNDGGTGTLTRTNYITITQGTPVITWSPLSDIGYLTAISGSQLSATANIPGSFSYNVSSGNVLSAGSHIIHVVFTPTDTVNYSSTSADNTINVTKASTAVTWGALDNITHPTALSNTQLGATASVPGNFVYNQSVGDVLSAGTHTIHVDFTPTDSVNYTGSSANNILIINKSNSIVDWSNPQDIQYNTSLSSNQLSATANVPGAFTYTPTIGTILSAGNNQNLQVNFVPTDTVNYTSSSKTVHINVTQLSPTLTWNQPDDINYTVALSNTQLNCQASVQGTFIYTPPVGTVLGVGTQSLRTDFTPQDSTNYTTANKTVTLNVSKATTSVVWSNPQDIVFNTSLGNSQLNAVGSVPGTIIYSPVSGTILSAGQHTLHADFTANDSANYSSSSKDVTINVIQISPVITWNQPTDIQYDNPLNSTQLSASANVPGSLVYTPPSGTIMSAGQGQTLRVDFTPQDSINYTNANKSVTINVTKNTSTVAWINPHDIQFNTSLSVTQLCATASIPGSFVYNPVSGTILHAGNNQVLHVDFTPSDSQNYSSSSLDVHINVTQLTPSITWINPANMNYTDALTSSQLNAQASISGALTYTPPINTVLGTGNNQPLRVDFVPTDDVNYTNANKTVYVNVTKASTSVSWNTPANITAGIALSSQQLNAQGSVAGSITYIPPAGTVLSVGSHELEADFTPTDATNYSTSTKNVTIWVIQPAPVTGFSSNISSGTYPVTVSFTDSSTNTPTSWQWNFGDGSNNVTNQNTVHTFVGTGTFHVTLTASNAGGSSSIQHDIIVNKSETTISWSNPINITFPTPLSSVQLNAQGSVPGNFVYDPASGIVLDVGIHQLNTTFSPTDSVNYTSASAHVSITVTEAIPSANFSGNITQGTVPLTVQFTDNSTGTITNRSWNFGDGNSSYETNPVHTYNAVGLFTVSLNVSNNDGFNVSTKNNYINVSAVPILPPVASFTENRTSGVAPATIQFNDTSTGDVSYWLWNFGDNKGTHAQNPVHTYDNPGVYNVSLEVGGAGGNDTVNMTALITISKEIITPVANFSAEPTAGVAPLLVNFTDLSDNDPTNWLWDFGDNSTSIEKNPTHVYQNAGLYTINMMVNNSAGSDVMTKVDYINVSQALQVYANFTSNTTNGTVPLLVQFYDNSTGSPENFSWDFGDNSTSIEQNPLHQYNVSGNYTVSETVSLGSVNNTTTKVDYIVAELPPAAPPIAQFYANQTNIAVDGDNNITAMVKFTDTSIGQGINIWLWVFGDGHTSSEQNPVHTYTAAGVYNVFLTATSPYGTSTSQPIVITITQTSPNVSFITDAIEGYAPLTVQFTNTTGNYSGNFSWDFGDGFNSTEENPVHTYQNDGVFTATLTVVRNNQNYTASQVITVHYVTKASVKIQSSQPDQMNVVTTNDNMSMRLDQISKQSTMYHAAKSVEGGINGGYGLLIIGILILAAIGLWLLMKW